MEEVISSTSSSSDDDEGSVDPAEALFQRGSYLRSLRELERQDEAERHQHQHSPSASATSSGGDVQDDTITLSSYSKDTNGEILQIQLLLYDRYLKHQRYYDDLKHVDFQYIEYTVHASSLSNPSSSSDNNDADDDNDSPPPPPYIWLPLIVEQDKSLGKGGLCWDAAFILAEYMVAQHSWERVQRNNNNNNNNSSNRPLRILELGAGTGLCGLYLAMYLSNHNNYQSNNIEIALTDLPQLLRLLQRNINRNFATLPLHDNADSTAAEKKETLLQHYLVTSTAVSHSGSSHPGGCQVTASVLPWGDLQAETQHGQFDVVLGADVVASLYDPVALAQCLYRMLRFDDEDDNNPNTVYISYKERLSIRHRQFETELARWFDTVTVVDPLLLWPESTASSGPYRNRNPDVKILVAQGKRIEPRD